MKKSSQPVPTGFHTITPSLTVRNAAAAIDFYKKALGAEERMRMAGPDGKITHAELKIGDSIIFLNDELPAMGCKSPQTLGGTSSGFYLYVADVDTAFQRAVDAGGTSTMPVMDMFWGDRMGNFADPYGYTWTLSTHIQDMTQEEMEQGAKQFYADMAAQAQKKSA
ncbi:MAG: VOC family protein [Acidobacteriia bacterium]|nr:VOC family protein [Terriglobia bacterium]